ncbi:MAG: universal stress protein [Longimicrobiales bacterium]|nr:universal stress protein [Longimicrobiales bacterium]
MYDRIIVPIDEGRTEALDQARPLARELGCELTLLHVHYPREAPAELEALPQYRYQGVVETWDERDLEAEAHEVEWLASLADDVAELEPELTVSSRVVHAPLARSLSVGDASVLVLAPAQDIRIDGLNRTVIELLRGGGVPILVYPPGTPMLPIRRMVIPLDGSSFSTEVLGPALDFARVTGTRISLLEVVTRTGGLVRMFRPSGRSAEAAEQFLREVRASIPPEYGSVDVRVVEEGNAAAGIVRETHREDVDLVAMATHGRGGLRRLVLGSVAESVVRGARSPVLLYRPTGVDARRAPSDTTKATTA